MPNLHDRLRRGCQDISAKVMDGEAIIINLSNGVYYSMDKAGGLIWQMIEDGYSLEEILRTLLDRYDVDRERAQADVEQLTTELLQEGLVKVADDVSPVPARLPPSEPQKLPYESPTLNVYRDMGDLLALDPPRPGLDDIPWKDPKDGTR